MATTNKKVHFSYFERKQDFTPALQAELTNNIVFVEDTKEVYTHGEFFGIRGVTLNYDSSTAKLQLKDGGAVVSEMDASAFVKDGMLDSVELVKVQESGVSETAPYLKFVFNTDSGKTAVRVSVSTLVDTYDGSNVLLSGAFAPSSSYVAPSAGDSVDKAIANLTKGHSDNVTALAQKQAAITGAATTVTMNDLSPDRALVSSGSGKIAVSAVTATELGYVHGVTSGIQGQIDGVSALAAKGLKQEDLTTYTGTDGEIVQHVGATSGNFVNGYTYKFANIVIPKHTPYLDARELTGYEDYVSPTIYAGTKVVNGWQEYEGTPATYGRAYTFAIADLYVGATVLFGNTAKGVGIVGSILSDKFIVAVGSDLLEVPIPSTPYNTYDIYYMHDIYDETDGWAYLNVNQILRLNNTSELWNAEYTTKNVSDLHPYSNSTDYPIASGWQRINVQPSSEGAVSDLETRMTAAETAISGKPSSANLINGAPLSNAASYFYGVSTSAANATQKEVSIPSITQLNAGQVIVVVPTISSNVIQNATLKLNDFAAYPIICRNTYGANWQTWVENTPATFVFVGNEWRLIAKGSDTAYNLLSVADGIAGTSTTQTVVRADYLQQIIHGQIDKFVGTRAMTEDEYWDLVAAGTVQADTLYITYDNDWED